MFKRTVLSCPSAAAPPLQARGAFRSFPHFWGEDFLASLMFKIQLEPLKLRAWTLNGFVKFRQCHAMGLLCHSNTWPVVHELRVSLEEIYHGSTKRMKITRRRLNPDGRTVRTEDKILHIVIKRGFEKPRRVLNIR